MYIFFLISDTLRKWMLFQLLLQLFSYSSSMLKSDVTAQSPKGIKAMSTKNQTTYH